MTDSIPNAATMTAYRLLDQLHDLYNTQEPDKPTYAFLETLVYPMRSALQTGDHMLEAATPLLEANPINPFVTLQIAVAYVLEAERLADADQVEPAWRCIGEARFWHGITLVSMAPTAPNLAARLLGQAGGTAAHKASKEKLDKLKAWCEARLDEYRPQGLNEMARAAILVVDMPLSTARRNLTEFAKEWTAAGNW